MPKQQFQQPVLNISELPACYLQSYCSFGLTGWFVDILQPIPEQPRLLHDLTVGLAGTPVEQKVPEVLRAGIDHSPAFQGWGAGARPP